MKFLAALLVLVLPVGCARGGASDGRLRVVATIYPLQFVADAVAGARVDVTALTPTGAEPHDLELSPGQVSDLLDADLVIYVGGGLQPAVEELVGDIPNEQDALAAVDPLSVAGGLDPHMWLDPVRLSAVTEVVRSELARLDPEGSETYAIAAQDLVDELTELDGSFRETLSGCARDEIFVSHAAFSYLADRYDIHQVGIAGADPEAEPSPRRVEEVARAAREAGATTIFAERLVSDRIARTVAGEIDAQVAILDPLEGPPAEGDYLTAMEENRDALARALGCP